LAGAEVVIVDQGSKRYSAYVASPCIKLNSKVVHCTP
jgi:hypothetical protein